jgi:hypothetical protein
MMMVASIARPCRQAGKQEAHRHEMKEGQEQPYRNTQYWLALLSNTPVFGDHASLIVCCFVFVTTGSNSVVFGTELSHWSRCWAE